MPAPMRDGVGAHVQVLQRRDPVQRDEGLRHGLAVAEVDAEIGGAGDPARLRVPGLQRQRLVDRDRIVEIGQRGGGQRRARLGERGLQAPARRRLRGQRAGRGADRRIAGAAAQVAFGGVVVELAVGMADEQAHDEARRAVAALRATRVDQRLLHGMQARAVGQPLHRHHLAPGQHAHRQQAAVDRAVTRGAGGIALDQRHRAGTAIAVGAALLGAVQVLALQPAQQRFGGLGASQRDVRTVEAECRARGHATRVAQDRGDAPVGAHLMRDRGTPRRLAARWNRGRAWFRGRA